MFCIIGLFVILYKYTLYDHCMYSKTKDNVARKREQHPNNNVCTSHRANSLYASNHYWRMVEDFSVITGKIIPVLMHNFDQNKFPPYKNKTNLTFYSAI